MVVLEREKRKKKKLNTMSLVAIEWPRCSSTLSSKSQYEKKKGASKAKVAIKNQHTGDLIVAHPTRNN